MTTEPKLQPICVAPFPQAPISTAVPLEVPFDLPAPLAFDPAASVNWAAFVPDSVNNWAKACDEITVFCSNVPEPPPAAYADCAAESVVAVATGEAELDRGG